MICSTFPSILTHFHGKWHMILPTIYANLSIMDEGALIEHNPLQIEGWFIPIEIH